MTKLESAYEIIRQNGGCRGIDCYDCFLGNEDGECCTIGDAEDLELAKQYIKENENGKI